MNRKFNSSIAETQNIQVTVHSQYDREYSKFNEGDFFYLYHVSIENKGSVSVTLKKRYWHITDGFGRVHEVKGDGVIGQFPIIHPGEKHEYSSFCPLETEYGVMKGHYEMIRNDGKTLIIQIAPFRLSVFENLN